MANNCTPNIQAILNNLYSLGRYTAPAGAIEMAMSEANGAQVQAQLIGPKNGKYSKFSITWATGSCDTPVECDDFSCGGDGADASPLTACETFDNFSCMAMPSWKNIAINDLRDLGSMDTAQAFGAHLWDQMQKIKAAIDTAYVTWLCTEAGCFATGVESKTLNLLNALGAPNYRIDSEIMSDFADAGFGGITPVLLGNRQVKAFAEVQRNVGMDQAGIMLNNMRRFPAFYDKNIVEANCAPTVEGNEVMFALLPGVSNILSWSENSGIFASRVNSVNWDNVDLTQLLQTDSTYMHTTLQDPVSGMLFDLNVVYEPKCKQWQYHLKTYYKFFNLPTVGCKDSCFNGIVKYDVCPDTPPACATAPTA
jgi:hypothetical protein